MIFFTPIFLNRNFSPFFHFFPLFSPFSFLLLFIFPPILEFFYFYLHQGGQMTKYIPLHLRIGLFSVCKCWFLFIKGLFYLKLILDILYILETMILTSPGLCEHWQTLWWLPGSLDPHSHTVSSTGDFLFSHSPGIRFIIN